MKSLGIASAIFLCASISPAQTHIGLAAGLNFSKADQSNFYYTRASSSTGYALGGIIDCPVTKNLSFLIEPAYVEKGSSSQAFTILGNSPGLSFDLSYLEIPVLLKYSVGKDLRPYIVLGPSIGINLSSTVGAKISGPWFGELEVTADGGNIVRDIECSLEFGAGVSYQVDEILTLFVEARYTHAISNALRQTGVLLTTPDETITAGVRNNAVYKNSGVVVMFGFMLPL